MQVWASKWNDRAWLSRKARGVADADLFMACLLQQVCPNPIAVHVCCYGCYGGGGGAKLWTSNKNLMSESGQPSLVLRMLACHKPELNVVVSDGRLLSPVLYVFTEMPTLLLLVVPA